MNIESIATFVPETRYRLDQYCEKIGMPANVGKIVSRYHGVQEIPYADGISYYELMEKTVKQLLDQKSTDRLKYIIHCSANPAWPYAHFALGKLQEKFKLWNTEVFAVNIHECASTLSGFAVLNALLQREPTNSEAILVASDFEINPKRGLPSVPVSGDASASAWISNSGTHHRFIAAHLTSNPKFAGGIWRTPQEELEYQNTFYSMIHKNFLECLAKARMSFDSIKLILPVNSSIVSLSMLASSMGIDRERFYTKNISRYAHCFGADVLINLECALEDQLLRPGDYYMMFLIGSSGSFGTAIFQY